MAVLFVVSTSLTQGVQFRRAPSEVRMCVQKGLEQMLKMKQTTGFQNNRILKIIKTVKKNMILYQISTGRCSSPIPKEPAFCFNIGSLQLILPSFDAEKSHGETSADKSCM